MFSRLYQTNTYRIEAQLSGSSNLISFEKCFEIEADEETQKRITKISTIRNDRVFIPIKLNKYESVLHKLKCKGCVTLSILAKIFPTVFNTKVIKKQNSYVFLEENMDIIKDIVTPVIGEEMTEIIFDKKRKDGMNLCNNKNIEMHQEKKI